MNLMEAYIVFSIIIFLISSLFFEWLKPSMAFFLVILVLTLLNVISPEEALQGFANEQLAVIVLLLVLSAIFKKSTAIYSIFSY